MMENFEGRWVANGRRSTGVEAFANKVGESAFAYVFHQTVHLKVIHTRDSWFFQHWLYGKQIWEEAYQPGRRFRVTDAFGNELSIDSKIEKGNFISDGTYAGISFHCTRYVDSSHHMHVEWTLDDAKMIAVYDEADNVTSPLDTSSDLTFGRQT